MHILQQAQAYISDKSLLVWVVFGGQALIALLVIAMVIKISRNKPTVIAEEPEKYIPPNDNGEKIIELNRQIASLRGESDTQLAALKEKLNVKESELQNLNKEKGALAQELTKFKDSVVKSNTQFEQAQNELAQLKKINTGKTELEAQLKKAQDLLTVKEGELQNLNKEKSALTEELSKYKDSTAKDKTQFQADRQKADDFNVLVAGLNKEIETQNKIIAEYKNTAKAAPKPQQKGVVVEEDVNIGREEKRKRIGEVLLAQNFITRETLDKALESQKNTGCNLTQYLLSAGYINEQQLAQCLCMQFGVPYLPLSSYEIANNIIGLIPVEIVQKYWLVPLEKLGNLLTVVMVDPFDSTAIKEVENHSGCVVQAFVGILSEIMEALTKYYKLDLDGKAPAGKKGLPFFVDVENYQGPDRRKFVRFNSKVDIQFALNAAYVKSKTIDISQDGMQFECGRALEIGSYFTLEVNLPEDYSPLPIALVAQVVRVIMVNDTNFSVGIKIIKISRQELQAIIKYASTHQEKEAGAGV